MVTRWSRADRRLATACRSVRYLSLAALAAGLLTFTAPALGAPLSSPVEAGRYEFGRTQLLPTPTLSAANPLVAAGGMREGGLSALQVVAGTHNTRFLSISDRGPNGQPDSATGGRTFPTPGFAPTIYSLEARDDGSLGVLNRTQIRVGVADPLRADARFGGDPKLITGFRNVTTAALDDNMYLHTNDSTIAPFTPTDPYGLDTEGIQRDPRDGSYWLSDEYRPSIVRLRADGTMIQRIVPAGSSGLPTLGLDGTASTLGAFYGGANQPQLQQLLPSEYKARRQNRGMEGLAISADGKTLYGMLQNPLDTGRAGFATLGYGSACSASSDAGTASPTSANWYRDVRIVEIDISSPAAPKLTGEWLYRLDSVSATDVNAQGNMRVSDIAWQGNRKLLVDEHDDVGLANRHLYEVDLGSGTNIATAALTDTAAKRTAPATVAGKTQPLGCFLDNGSASELTTLGVAPAPKSNYLDLGPAGVGFLFPKVEGVTVLEGLPAVAVINDNDFGFTETGTNATDNVIAPAANPAEQLRIYTSRPAILAPSKVEGPARAGRALTCVPAKVGGTGTLSYAFTWLRDGAVVPGARGARYTLTRDDVGTRISCSVIGTRTFGAVVASASPSASGAVGPIAPAWNHRKPHAKHRHGPHHSGHGRD